MTDGLADRLRGLRVEIAPAVASRHLELIRSGLQTPAPRAQPRRRRRFVVVAAALLLVVLPVGVGIAAESSVPGDLLFPIKQVTEWARSFADDTVRADHRVDELEALLDRGADLDVVTDQLRRAEDSVRDLPADTVTHTRLDAARDRIERDYLAPGETHDVPPDQSHDDEPAVIPRTDTTATTSVRDAPPPPHRDDADTAPDHTHDPVPPTSTGDATDGGARDTPPPEDRAPRDG